MGGGETTVQEPPPPPPPVDYASIQADSEAKRIAAEQAMRAQFDEQSSQRDAAFKTQSDAYTARVNDLSGVVDTLTANNKALTDQLNAPKEEITASRLSSDQDALRQEQNITRSRGRRSLLTGSELGYGNLGTVGVRSSMGGS